ncbi:hypothetical protein [Jeotgalibacillus sp. R-1-5s-1]|uniref:hypothetical protein n=1 Tax=Jeotgalibacillus sp. R-1-5s-1 TaxID=2555897 RepID=UPI0010697F8C|nr:hypothetical protein [Jeotgalibacillus sp. R-1-5s-1]TFD93629.1 hypothetical protein E2491_14405 [Jeotgalibacillus sp. R-1-5s-1]
MKYLLSMVLASCFLLLGCNEQSSILSISEIETVPNEVKEAIGLEYNLQLIQEDDQTYYLFFRSSGDVSTSLETVEDTLMIKLDEDNANDENPMGKVYKLTIDPVHEVIEAVINGETVPFDNVTGI